MAASENDKTIKSNRPKELIHVDTLLQSAAISIDNGEFEKAILEFEQIIELTQGFFGENIELAELKRKINELQQQLKQMKTI